jgi:hypothetical protein
MRIARPLPRTMETIISKGVYAWIILTQAEIHASCPLILDQRERREMNKLVETT